MKLTPELYALAVVSVVTVLMWIPYMAARIFTRGPVKTLANPDPSFKPDPAWAERARRAHANAVENLAVFAPLVLIAALIGASTPTTIMAAKVYLWARIAHYIVYTLGIPVLRTLTFATAFAATLAIAGVVLGQV
jgi:uncharacterized MAPEG superfamily protein